MWKLEQNSVSPAPQLPTVATVSFCENGSVGASGSYEYRGIPFFAPAGVDYLPKAGDRMLIVSTDSGDVCVGIMGGDRQGAGLNSGELRLSSQGGAAITLRNDGSVVINGTVITANGKILEGGMG